MNYFNARTCTKGITFVEVLVVIALSILLFVLVLTVFSRFTQSKTLVGATNEIISILSEARSLTLGAKEDSVYSVHFESDKAVLFKGSTYSSIDPDNKVTLFSTKISISSIALSGGGADVVFDRLTGVTSNYGIVTLTLVATGASTTVTIQETGIAEN